MITPRSDAYKVGWAQQTIHSLIERVSAVHANPSDTGVHLSAWEWAMLVRLAEVLGPLESTS